MSKRITAFRDSIPLRALGKQTMPSHAYRNRRGIEMYVWVRGLDGRGVVGVAMLTRRQIEEYLAAIAEAGQ